MVLDIKNIQKYKKTVLTLLSLLIFLFVGGLTWVLYKTFLVVQPLSLMHVQDIHTVAVIDFADSGKKELASYDETFFSYDQLFSSVHIAQDILLPSKSPFKNKVYILFGKDYHIIAGVVPREEIQEYLSKPYPNYEMVYERGVLFLSSGKNLTEILKSDESTVTEQLQSQHISFADDLLFQAAFLRPSELLGTFWGKYPEHHIEQYLTSTLLPDLQSCSLSLQSSDKIPHLLFSCETGHDDMQDLAALQPLDLALLPATQTDGKHESILGFSYNHGLFEQFAKRMENRKGISVSVLLTALESGFLQKIIPLPTLEKYLKEIPPTSVVLAWDREQVLEGGIAKPMDDGISSFTKLAEKVFILLHASTHVKENVVTLPDQTKGVVLSVEEVTPKKQSASGATLTTVDDFPVVMNTLPKGIFTFFQKDKVFLEWQKMLSNGNSPYRSHADIHFFARTPVRLFQPFMSGFGSFWKEDSVTGKALYTTLSFEKNKFVFVFTPELAPTQK